MSFSEPCALAVDFGGTSIKMGVTAGERILATADRIPTAMFESPQAIIDAMIASARTLRGQFPSACVMGMGMPGWCDYQRGVLYQLTNVRVWDREIPVKEMMEQALGLPVVLDNDANCMAYAEWKMGAGRGMSSLVCLTMGTGIGGGIVVHDRMLRGRRLSAAELGQTSIHYQGKTGPFGSRGAIEEYIGNNELAAEAVKRYAGAGIIKTVDECTPRHLDEAARSGCPIALQLWEDTAEMLGCLIMNLMYTLVPDAFIIGGRCGQGRGFDEATAGEPQETVVSSPDGGFGKFCLPDLERRRGCWEREPWRWMNSWGWGFWNGLRIRNQRRLFVSLG